MYSQTQLWRYNEHVLDRPILFVITIIRYSWFDLSVYYNLSSELSLSWLIIIHKAFYKFLKSHWLHYEFDYIDYREELWALVYFSGPKFFKTKFWLLLK